MMEARWWKFSMTWPNLVELREMRAVEAETVQLSKNTPFPPQRTRDVHKSVK